MLSLRSPRLNSKRFIGVSIGDGSGGTNRSFIRGGGAIGGAILRIVAESSRESCGRFSGELLPFVVPFSPAREGILEGLFCADADTEAPKFGPTDCAKVLRDMLAAETLWPKFDTGVFDRLGGAPRTVPARLGAAEALPTVAGLVGIPLLEGVFARGGGAAFCAAAYSSSRYRLPWTRKGRPYSSSQLSRVTLRSCDVLAQFLLLD